LVVGKWRCGGFFKGQRISSETGTIQDMDIQKKELWERLENEPERAYRAFECFLSLPSDHRTIVEAYRVYVGNSEAVKPSDTWAKWSHDYAWRERAAAFDDHIASVRREAHEQVIKEQAERQAREVEKVRGRYNELMSVAYEAAMEWFEDSDWSKANLRSGDVVKIIQLHMDAADKFSGDLVKPEGDDWDESSIEESEDDGWGSDIVAEIDAEAEARRAAGDDSEPEEDLL
jgi:hypothetical protein